jgi:hypothetical protein
MNLKASPSIQRTSPGKPGLASHVKRQAPQMGNPVQIAEKFTLVDVYDDTLESVMFVPTNRSSLAKGWGHLQRDTLCDAASDKAVWVCEQSRRLGVASCKLFKSDRLRRRRHHRWCASHP